MAGLAERVADAIRSSLEEGSSFELGGAEESELKVGGFIAAMSGDAVLQLELVDDRTGQLVNRVWLTVSWPSLDRVAGVSARRMLLESASL